MRVQNIRFGYACNSSSTHSIIIFKKDPKLADDLDPCGGDTDYGHGKFVLASKDEKLKYLSLLLLYSAAKQDIPKYLWEYYANHWLDGQEALKECNPGIISNLDVSRNELGYIDHQSVLMFPTYFNSKFLNKEFFDEFKKHVLDDRVVIFGGGDNNDGEFPRMSAGMSRSNVADALSCDGNESIRQVARQDPVYGHWVLFHRTHDNKAIKVRLTFDDQEIKYSSLPELVDLKITDYCNMGCPYCYQGSSSAGKHADLEKIKRLLQSLSKLQVFEVALGGGETTLHPDFLEILKLCKDLGIVPNFTTRNINWFRNEKNVEVFKECCGSVAFSIDHVYGILHEIMPIVKYWDLEDYVSIQCIDTIANIESIIKVCELPLILLGYKKCGRGASYLDQKTLSRYDHTPFKDVVSGMKKSWQQVGVDTKYLQDYRDEVLDVAPERVFYTAEEGVYSMYIDAVEMKMGSI